MRVDKTPVLTASVVLLSVALSSLDLQAQQESRRGRGFSGDWRVKMDFDGRTREAILAFSRDESGNRTGQWISFFGVTDLKDLVYEDGKLSFVQSRQNRDGETVTSKFTGSISEGKLTGTLSSDRGETRVEGTRIPRDPRVAGTWETKFTVGEREVTNMLVISATEAGELAVDWQSDRVKHKISNVESERGRLTFKTDSTMDDRQWQSTFEATFEGDAYTGVIKSEQGDRPVAGKRLGAAAIGTWNLGISSDRGERKQRLRVFPDMSALYGATPVKKVEFQDGKVSFKVSLEFGDQTFEQSFQGKIDGDSLTGESTTSRGAQKVTGKKVAERSGRGDRQRGDGQNRDF